MGVSRNDIRKKIAQMEAWIKEHGDALRPVDKKGLYLSEALKDIAQSIILKEPGTRVESRTLRTSFRPFCYSVDGKSHPFCLLISQKEQKVPGKPESPKEDWIKYPGTETPSPMHSMMVAAYRRNYEFGGKQYSGFMLAMMGNELTQQITENIHDDDEKVEFQKKQKEYKEFYADVASYPLCIGSTKKYIQITPSTSGYVPGHTIAAGPGSEPLVMIARQAADTHRTAMMELMDKFQNDNQFKDSFAHEELQLEEAGETQSELKGLNNPAILKLLNDHCYEIHEDFNKRVHMENDCDPESLLELAIKANSSDVMYTVAQNSKPASSIGQFWHMHFMKFTPGATPPIDTAKTTPVVKGKNFEVHKVHFPGTTLTLRLQDATTFDLSKLQNVAKRIAKDTDERVTIALRAVPQDSQGKEFALQFLLLKNPDRYLYNTEREALTTVPEEGVTISRGTGFPNPWGWAETVGIFPTEDESITSEQVDAVYDKVDLYGIDDEDLECAIHAMKEELEDFRKKELMSEAE